MTVVRRVASILYYDLKSFLKKKKNHYFLPRVSYHSASFQGEFKVNLNLIYLFIYLNKNDTYEERYKR